MAISTVTASSAASRWPRRLLIAAMALLALAVLLAMAYRIALKQLQGTVEAALGPRASVGSVQVGWHTVELRDLRVRGERGGMSPPGRPKGSYRSAQHEGAPVTPWPVDDELRAERVVIVPDLRSLLGDTWRVRRITITKAYVSALRTRDGKLRLLPGMLESQPNGAAGSTAAPTAGEAPAETSASLSAQPGAVGRSMPPVHIGRVELRDAEVEFFDASIRQPAHRIRLTALAADVGPLELPTLGQPVKLDLQAVFKGPQHDGRITINGAITPATRDAVVQARVTGVDLIALQPYLLRVNEGGVKRGTLDLALQGTVVNNRLKAPGQVTLTNLELGQGGGLFSTFAGVPRQAVVAAMSRDGKLTVKFTLDGRLDDPAFSINENFATRLAGGLAEGLGVSLGGVVQGVGQVIKGLFGN